MIWSDIDAGNYLLVLIAVILVVFVFGLVVRINETAKRNAKLKSLRKIVDESSFVSIEDFLALKDSFPQIKDWKKKTSFVGCYIIHNITKDICYVGESKHVPQRIYDHFHGSGNGDVYADYKNGDQFEIKMIDLVDSGYHNLYNLEADLIESNKAYKNGYNRLPRSY
ncbi:GIY-YIG nuclease family protein [Bifidobacterium sp. SO1]|uniref:GIY-YIG nuclease family protein n=1 Tax=Bifidobacterium sp. SO1 TaxID=2809029 RepID=UPI001BDD4410|nr:GIY-YIG nuclease family protein [Bifidobacterium sp. SO1]MBT1162555.1 GIY-YIG nuclease family protein [Bifidobacterium sp. SO1]